MHRRSLFAFLLAHVALSALLSGCSVLEIKNQIDRLEGTAIIEGDVRRLTRQEGLLNVLIFEQINGELRYEGSTYANEFGHYRFYVTPGTYLLAAHIDVDRDGKYEPGEPLTKQWPGVWVDVAAGQKRALPTLEVEDKPNSVLGLDTSERKSLFYENIGKLVAMDSPIFSQNNYSLGLWQPFNFMESVGGGLFMLQPYDQNKIPLLFIHGMNGGPTDWNSVIESIDQARFQPWIFYYPSGVQLDITSSNLIQAMDEMHKHLRFTRFMIAAHSMGGLVTRDFVRKFQEQFPHDYRMLKMVITVNSPLGGMDSAAFGARHSPVVVHAWKDVASGSDFVRKLTAWPWPKDIPYHLVFSFAPGRADDGTVSISNQIPLAIQKNAKNIYGINNTHNGTLTDPAFIALFNEILEETARACSH